MNQKLVEEQKLIRLALLEHNLDVKHKIKMVQQEKEYQKHLKLLGIQSM